MRKFKIQTYLLAQSKTGVEINVKQQRGQEDYYSFTVPVLSEKKHEKNQPSKL